MTNRLRMLAGAAVLIAGGIASGAADAAIALRASVSTDGGATFTSLGTVFDNGVGDFDATLGSMLSVQSGLGVAVSLETAQGFPIIPFPQFSVSANATAASPLLLRVEFTQTDVGAGSPGSLLSDFAVGTLLSGSSVTTSSYISASNVAFATDTPLFSNLFTDSGQVDAADGVAVGLPFSETIRMDVNFAAAGTTVALAQIVAVPEPGALALLGAGLIGLGLVRRARRKA